MFESDPEEGILSVQWKSKDRIDAAGQFDAVF